MIFKQPKTKLEEIFICAVVLGVAGADYVRKNPFKIILPIAFFGAGYAAGSMSKSSAAQEPAPHVQTIQPR